MTETPELWHPPPADAPPPPGAPPAREPSRRGVLLGGAGVLVAAGAGTAAGLVRRHPVAPPPPVPPAALVEALRRERDLLAGLDAAPPGLDRRRLAAVRADHRAHAAAFEDLLAPYAALAPSVAATSPQTARRLRAAESAAATAGARASAVATGELSVLLAVIAACEASHLELL